jgi:predicted transcriptional regulator
LTFSEVKEKLVAHIQTKLSPPVKLEKLMTKVPILIHKSKSVKDTLNQVFLTTPAKKVPVVDDDNVFFF